MASERASWLRPGEAFRLALATHHSLNLLRTTLTTATEQAHCSRALSGAWPTTLGVMYGSDPPGNPSPGRVLSLCHTGTNCSSQELDRVVAGPSRTRTVATGAKWTNEEDQRLLALRAKDKSITVIAKEFPRTEAAVWGRWLLLRKRAQYGTDDGRSKVSAIAPRRF